MLYDKGLPTEEDRKLMSDMIEYRRNNAHGCVDRAICEKCNHLIVDSVRLCSGHFICPNCGHHSGLFNKFIEALALKTTTPIELDILKLLDT